MCFNVCSEYMLVFMKYPSSCSNTQLDRRNTLQRCGHAWGKSRCKNVNAGCLRLIITAVRTCLSKMSHILKKTLCSVSPYNHPLNLHTNMRARARPHAHTGKGIHYRRIRLMESSSSVGWGNMLLFPKSSRL